MDHLPQFLNQLAGVLAVVAPAAAAGFAGAAVLAAVARRIARHTPWHIDDLLAERCRRPALWLVPLVAVLVTLPGAGLKGAGLEVAHRVLAIGLAAGLGWLAVAVVQAIADRIVDAHDIHRPDNLEQRRLLTQIQVLRRVVVFTIVLVTLAAMLTAIPSIRTLGVSLFASAGIAGLIAGLAARPAIANLIAGLQIALTQPIRLDDVVIVEGEWGWIEEIHTTYVVVRIWDLRRLVVPLSYFIEKPFQNWTRRTADLLGTVYLYTDYTVPVDEVRAELKRVVQESGLWDGKTCDLAVTNATDRSMELRAVLSAPDSGRAWDLRCHVREKMIAFLQARYPESLPRVRAEFPGRGAEPGAEPGAES